MNDPTTWSSVYGKALLLLSGMVDGVTKCLVKWLEEGASLHTKGRDHRARLPEIHTAQATAVIRDDYALAQKLKQDEADLLLAMQHIEETLAEVRAKRNHLYNIQCSIYT